MVVSVDVGMELVATFVPRLERAARILGAGSGGSGVRPPTWSVRLSGPEDGAADPHVRRAERDGQREVGAHPHR